jgi:hypothetical protein
VLGSQSFVMNEAERQIELVVPDDVLYDSLQVIEQVDGTTGLLAPFSDENQPYSLGTLFFQKTTCLTYDGLVLPEDDPAAPTPWELVSANPIHASASVAGGVLTYSTDVTGTKTVYRNATPLPDSIGLHTEVKFRIKLLNDSSGGAGDTQVRFGFSSPGVTVALAFVSTPLGERYVLVMDLNNGRIVGGIPFDFADGLFHDYRLVRDPSVDAIQVFIDS